MPNRRTQLHPAAIERLRQKLYADTHPQSDNASPWLVRLEHVQLWGLLLFGIAWCALIIAAPILLVLFLFGLN